MQVSAAIWNGTMTSINIDQSRQKAMTFTGLSEEDDHKIISKIFHTDCKEYLTISILWKKGIEK